jgi:hypothetical protein
MPDYGTAGQCGQWHQRAPHLADARQENDMLTATTHAARDTKHNMTRAMYVAGGAAAAAIGWAIEVPLFGIHLRAQFGSMHPQTIPAGQIIGSALAAGLIGWLLLAVLERRTPRARTAWTAIAVLVFTASLALPLAAATTYSATAGLAALHLAVAAAVIPGLARTARAR